MNCQYHPLKGSTIYVVIGGEAVHIFTQNYSEYSRKTYVSLCELSGLNMQ